MITEVIPKGQKNAIAESQYSLDGYNVYKNFDNNKLDLGKSGQRWVAIYIKENMSVIRLKRYQERMMTIFGSKYHYRTISSLWMHLS